MQAAQELTAAFIPYSSICASRKRPENVVLCVAFGAVLFRQVGDASAGRASTAFLTVHSVQVSGTDGKFQICPRFWLLSVSSDACLAALVLLLVLLMMRNQHH